MLVPASNGDGAGPIVSGGAEDLASFASSLPEALRMYWKRTRHPIRSIWTYWDLDKDMRAGVESDRLRLMRSIMRAKNISEEQVCLWPLAVHAGPDPAPRLHQDTFIALVKRFVPPYILIFGKKTRAVFNDYCRQKNTTLPERCTVLYLPGPGEMLPDNKQAKTVAWNSIKNLEI